MSKIVKPDAGWRADLSLTAYHVPREKGTERPFTDQYRDCDEDDIYRCIGLDAGTPEFM